MSQRDNSTRSRTAIATLAALGIAAGGAVFALAAPAPDNHSSETKRAHTLRLRAAIARRTVAPGGVATYRIRIHRGSRLILPRGRRRRAARVQLTVRRPLPAGVRASFRPPGTRSSASTLKLTTTTTTRPGSYRIRIRARGRLRRHARLYSAHTTVTLVVAAPKQRSFTISGTVAGLLAPGVAAPVDLGMTNPHGGALQISELTVTVAGIQAPQADADHPCTGEDFAVGQFSGAYGFVLPPRSTRSLSALGVATSQWPQLLLTNRPVNQDGCKHAKLTLRFTGTGTGAD